MNILERWHNDKVIKIMMAQPAQDEAAYGSRNRAKKAYKYICTMTESHTPKEIELLKSIENILFPAGASTKNEKNDIEIVFNARKYGCTLITNDGGSRRQRCGILGKRDELSKIGISVLTDEEAVMLIRQLIQERDSLEREKCNITGQPLPEWLGRD
jgi:acetate kinase